MGLVDAVGGYVFSFMDPRSLQQGLLIPGNVSLVVQSGLLSAGFLVDVMSHRVMGISKVCSIGNKIDVNECDLLSYLIQDANTEVIGHYLESFSDGRRFTELCRKSTKPIVVLHGGKSRKGAEAAMSHTASMAGNHKIISGALAQAGVTEAGDFHQMMDICRSLSARPRPAGRHGRIAVLTFSGGSGIVASDFMEEHGLTVAELSRETKDALGRLFPDWMPVGNPVDLWPAIEKHGGTNVDVYSTALSAVLEIQQSMPFSSTPLREIFRLESMSQILPSRRVRPASLCSYGSWEDKKRPFVLRQRPSLAVFLYSRKYPAPWNAWLPFSISRDHLKFLTTAGERKDYAPPR